MDTLPLEFNDPVIEIIHPNPEQDIILAPGGVPMTFVWSPAGSFMMGSPETELGQYVNEDVFPGQTECTVYVLCAIN